MALWILIANNVKRGTPNLLDMIDDLLGNIHYNIFWLIIGLLLIGNYRIEAFKVSSKIDS